MTDLLRQILTALLALLTIDDRVAKLEHLLEGAQRIDSPDGVQGLYFPMRVGVQTAYWLQQPKGAGAGFSFTTGFDRMAMYGENESALPDSVIAQLNTTTISKESNTGLCIVAMNSSTKCVGIRVIAQAGPQGSPNTAINAQLTTVDGKVVKEQMVP